MLTFLTHKNSSFSFTCSRLTKDVFPVPNLQSPHSHTAQPFNSASLMPSARDSQSQDEQRADTDSTLGWLLRTGTEESKRSNAST